MRNRPQPGSSPGGNRGGSGGARRPGSRPNIGGGSRSSASGRTGQSRPAPSRRPRPQEDTFGDDGFRIIERTSNAVTLEADDADRPFRVLIAVHRPRFRGRVERAAALEGWEVTSLLNKQDPVGQVQKGPHPPDLLILSGDFGRQKDYAIFRAVQHWREKGMTLIGMVDDCEDSPETYPDSVPSRLCDVCLEPPYKTPDLRALFSRLYEEKRGEPAPPPRSNAKMDMDADNEE